MTYFGERERWNLFPDSRTGWFERETPLTDWWASYGVSNLVDTMRESGVEAGSFAQRLSEWLVGKSKYIIEEKMDRDDEDTSSGYNAELDEFLGTFRINQ